MAGHAAEEEPTIIGTVRAASTCPSVVADPPRSSTAKAIATEAAVTPRKVTVRDARYQANAGWRSGPREAAGSRLVHDEGEQREVDQLGAVGAWGTRTVVQEGGGLLEQGPGALPRGAVDPQLGVRDQPRGSAAAGAMPALSSSTAARTTIAAASGSAAAPTLRGRSSSRQWCR